MKRKASALLSLVAVASAASFYDFDVTTITGENTNMAIYKSKVALVVNGTNFPSIMSS